MLENLSVPEAAPDQYTRLVYVAVETQNVLRVSCSCTASGTQQAHPAHMPGKSAWQLALRVRQVYRQCARLGRPRCALRTLKKELLQNLWR